MCEFVVGTAPSNATATSPAASAEASGSLRDEYITNLQQQIYFLELENNLLKKSGGTGSGGGKGAGPGLDIDASGPLESHLSTLRLKYTDLEAQYKQEMEV